MTDTLRLQGASVDDPFVSTPPHAHPSQPVRHGVFDPDTFTPPSNSAQARLALEAHLKETDRRIQDASKLGTTLVHQRKELAARLKELNEHGDADDIGPELKKKLAELEKEFTDVGRETARAVLPRSRMASSEHPEFPASPAVFSGVSGASPSKVAAPSRKQRNQQTSRVHDIEFATEISTSLLAQVRSLQAALAEKDDALRLESSEKSELEADYTALVLKLRHLDDNEQKYKDENWNLETQLQDLTAAMKHSTEKEQKANQSLKSTQAEKEAILRELEDLKQAHGQFTDDTAANKRAHESELHILRRDLAGHEHERDQLQRKIDELTAQNTELARAISYRMNADGNPIEELHGSGDDEANANRDLADISPPASPTKRAAGGVLETETLRSSIQHAHRMIQTLKNNIHREKSEKLELKRLLQDARDELEAKRGDNKVSALKKRRSELDAAKNRKVRAEQLGSNRVSREEIINDPDWEDDDGQYHGYGNRAVAAAAASVPGAYLMSEESTDAFETANERDATETEAFQTTNEGMDSEDSGQATETESIAKVVPVGKRYSTMPPSLVNTKRASYMSTASTSADEDEDSLSTPVMQQSRFVKSKNPKSRTSLRESVVSNNSPAMSGSYRNSPAFSNLSSNRSTPLANGQTLGDELDGLSDEESMMSGTPSRIISAGSTPADIKLRSPNQLFASEPGMRRPEMVDSGMMTEAWEPETKPEQSKGIVAATAGAIGGLVTGAFLGRRSAESDEEHVPSQPADMSEAAVHNHTLSQLVSNHTEPSRPMQSEHNYSNMTSQHVIPVETPQRTPPSHSLGNIMSQNTEPVGTPDTEIADESHFYEMSPIKSQSYEPLYPDHNQAVFPQRMSSKRSDTGVHAASDAALIAGAVAADRALNHGEATYPSRLDSRTRTPFAEISSNAAAAGHIPTADEGTQTVVSSQEIDSLMKGKSVAVNGAGVVYVVPDSPSRPSANMSSPRRSSEPGTRPDGNTIRRPGSASSIRSKISTPPPPLPNDHNQKIAQATTRAPGSMGPPLMPASAYRTNQRAPSIQSRSSTMNTVNKPTSVRATTVAGSLRSPISRRSSVSSFASEIDHRLNPLGAFAYPSDLPISTDPRMIAAITQTMIGEYLWKYTRSPLSSTTLSSNRHRRFFWIHPYTRTLYWSETDPSAAGKAQLKAKSVAIESVRMVDDDNAYPPGLHHKSLVVVTPAREIVFTAPTSQRHETWFNALSYLLLRTGAPGADPTTNAVMTGAATGGGADDIDDDDIAEFNPSYGSRAPSTRYGTAHASRVSLATATGSVAGRSQHSVSYRHPEQPTLMTTPSRPGTGSAAETLRSPTSGRISNMFSSTRSRRSMSSSRRSRSSTMASNAAAATAPPTPGVLQSRQSNDADEARRAIEDQERLDRLENVRACCDGKHDVGSLARRGESFRTASSNTSTAGSRI